MTDNVTFPLLGKDPFSSSLELCMTDNEMCLENQRFTALLKSSL